MKTKYITNWQIWKELCWDWGIDPYENVDHSIDLGGGNSRDYEYTGDIPAKEKQCPSCGKWILIEATGCICQLEEED